MCYSSKVSQNIKDLARQFSATMDYSEVERLMMERLGGRPIRLARGFEWNFSNPQTPQERRIADLDTEYRAKKVAELEQEIFKQKKRLADAQRKLKVKETKSALNEQRIATSKIDASLERIALLTGTQPHEDDHRIFPMTYAPIILKRDGRNVITLARYHLRQQGKAGVHRSEVSRALQRASRQPRALLAQRVRTHARVDGDGFVLRERRARRQERGAALHSTTCLSDCSSRACMRIGRIRRKVDLLSFAAVTDEPPPEIKAAGHDRCIINLRPENVEAWLSPEGRSDQELQAILSDRQQPYYEHEVMAA